MLFRPKRLSAVVVSSLVVVGLAGPLAASSRDRTVAAVGDVANACTDVAVDTSSRVLERRVMFLGFADETPARLRDLAHNGIGGFFIMGSRANAASLPKLKAQLAGIDAGVL